MGRVMAWTCLTAFFLSLVSATILSNVAFFPIVPDLVLVLVVYVSFLNGTVIGSTAGFFSGLLLDFLSAAPIGLNACTKALMGFVAGKFTGAFNLDRVVIPFVMGVIATVLKAGTILALSLFFGPGIVTYRLVGPDFWLELLANGVSTPILFSLLSMFPTLYRHGRI